jgi:hypothetical protein
MLAAQSSMAVQTAQVYLDAHIPQRWWTEPLTKMLLELSLLKVEVKLCHLCFVCT